MTENLLPNSEILKNLNIASKDIGKLTKVKDLVEIIPAIFLALKDILAKLDHITDQKNELDKKNIALESEISFLKTQICDLQNEKCKNTVRVHGLQKIKENELPSDTASVFQKLLKDLNIENDCKFTKAIRIKTKDNNTHDQPIIINFSSNKDHNVFFKNLKNLKELEQYRIFVNQDFPAVLNSRLKELIKTAKQLRKLSLKTSIRYSQGQLHLFTKSGFQPWKKHEN